jgi:DNA-directed RNA polymerase subunit N (RpoN/RPB10)
MYPFILCPTCGNSLGELYPAFCKKREIKYREYCKANKINIQPTYRFMSQVGLNLGDILDWLELRSDCCRTAMMTQVLFREVY